MNTKSAIKQNLTCSFAGHHAKLFRQQDSDTDLMMNVETWPYSLYDLYQYVSQTTSCGKISLEFYPTTADEPSDNSPTTFLNAGIVAPGGCLTLNTSESPNHAGGSTLSDIMIGDVQRSEERRVGKECRSRWS